MSELMTFSLINKKVVTNDMQSVTTMAQMWGFRPLKAKAFFGTPAGHRNSPPDCFYPSDCPVRIPFFTSKIKSRKSGSLFLAQMWGFEPQKPR